MNFIKKVFGKHLFLNFWYSFSIAWLVHLIGWWTRSTSNLVYNYFEVRQEQFVYVFLTALVFFTVRDYLKDKTI